MMNVTIDTDGTGVVTLPGQSIPIVAPDSDAARAQAVNILLEYTARAGSRQYVHAIDTGTSLQLAVDPDGAVHVDREHARAIGKLEAVSVDDTVASIADIRGDSAAFPARIAEPRTAPPVDQDFDLTGGTEMRTRVRSALLTLDDGTTEVVRGTTLLGRKPPQDAEGVDATLTVEDPERSVSKAHCILSIHDNALWVTDQSSANGTTIIEPGKAPIDLNPGHARTVVTGTQLLIGDRSFTVTIPAPRATRPRTL
jgi:hypothetical protein